MADIGADKVIRSAQFDWTGKVIYPVIFGDGTPATMFNNGRWERFV